MPRLAHGAVPTPEQVLEAQNDLASRTAEVDLGFAVAGPAALQDFDFLFPSLQNDHANLLPESRRHARRRSRPSAGPCSTPAPTADPATRAIPAAYTYFGQFVDHDITLEDRLGTTARRCCSTDLAPLALAHDPQRPPNLRTATLDLDSLYGPPAPRDRRQPHRCDRDGHVAQRDRAAARCGRTGKDDDNDLPREPRSPDSAARPRRPDRRSAQRREH